MKRFFQLLKRFLHRTLALVELIAVRCIFRSNSQPVGDRIIVLQNSHLGDFVLSLPFFQRLKRQCGLPLVLISDSRIRELAEASGIFAEFVALDMKKVSSYKHCFCRWKTLYKLHKLSGKKVIQCFGVGATGFEDCAVLAVQAPEKYVFVDSFYNVQRSGVLYEAVRTKFFNRTLPYRLEQSLVQNENNYADFITGTAEPLTLGDLDCFEPLPEADEILQPYLLVIPGADDPRRRWETEKFAWLASQVAAQQQLNILISGSPSEQELIQKVYDLLPENVQKKARIRAAAVDKSTSIKQLMSDVKHASILLTNDTGPMHIAAKYGIRCYCITGGWHWKIFSPCKEYSNTKFLHHEMPCYQCGSFCPYPGVPFKCLQELTAEKSKRYVFEK